MLHSGNSIRVSQKHGVNPSMGMCFWCGEENGTIVLAGYLPGDAEAPRKMFTGYEPCEKCQENMAQGITLMCGAETQQFTGQPAMQENPHKIYPDGRWLVVTEGLIRRMFNEHADLVIEKRRSFVDKETFNFLVEKANG